MTNDKIYLDKCDTILVANMKIPSSNIIGSPCFCDNDSVENLDHLSKHCITLFEFDLNTMDYIDIYTAIINARARGLPLSTSFSDIIVSDHCEN